MRENNNIEDVELDDGSGPSSDNGSTDISTNQKGSNGDLSTLENESGTQDKYNSHNEFSKTESMVVNRLRFLVFVVILIAAVSISTTVYLITRDGESKEFETRFNGMAEQLKSTFDDIASQKIGVIGGLRISLIAHALDHNKTWPFVTLSSFQRRAATVTRMSNSIYLGIHPIIEDANRVEWEEYVASEGFQWM
jgi:hypothetical protein